MDSEPLDAVSLEPVGIGPIAALRRTSLAIAEFEDAATAKRGRYMKHARAIRPPSST
jgi:hypothetical protein